MAKIEDGVAVGNTYDKYRSSNPLLKWMVRNFLATFDGLVAQTSRKPFSKRVAAKAT